MSTVYDVWLHLAIGAATSKTEQVFDRFGGSKEVFDAGEQEWRMCSLLTANNVQKMSSLSLQEAQAVLNECKQKGISTASFYEDNYPKRLFDAPDRPFMLFYKGEINIPPDTLSVAMVGTRRAGQYGADCATQLARSLALKGAVVVSGGAEGIDTLSHTAALRAGGRSLCVLGCGIEYPYLTKNKALREAVSHSGALVSEYAPHTPPTKYSFIARNRIISGLSDATVVIEAGEKSGALTTAKAARLQGRTLFAVAGGMFSDSFKGSNDLLKNGAYAVFSAEDIFEKCGIEQRPISADQTAVPEKPAEKRISFEKPEPPDHLSANALLVYNAFTLSQMTADELQSQTGLSASSLLISISELELNGIITAVGGRKYRFIIQK